MEELLAEYDLITTKRVKLNNSYYFGNMFVASKKRYDAYCEWLFSIFAVVAERIELETGRMPITGWECSARRQRHVR